MNRLFRSILGVSASVLLAGVSGCAAPSGDPEAAPPSGGQQGKALESFDPCTFFKPDELKSWGMPPTQGEDDTQLSWEPTCTWHGDEKNISLSKNVEETVASYKENGNWESYEEQQVAGRSGAVAQVAGAESSGMGCNVLIDAGGGVAIYQTTIDATSAVDPCPELMKTVEATASRLPE